MYLFGGVSGPLKETPRYIQTLQALRAEVMFLVFLGNAWGSPRRKWEVFLGRRLSENPAQPTATSTQYYHSVGLCNFVTLFFSHSLDFLDPFPRVLLASTRDKSRGDKEETQGNGCFFFFFRSQLKLDFMNLTGITVLITQFFFTTAT